jgi:PAS domain S-box-containing protein
VLCLPILRQSSLVGILYLENSLATHAFTPDRVQVLELLASQAAISLDNARLYADVRDSHARIRRLVESNIIGIFFWGLSGNITDANDAFLRMVGYSRQDLATGQVQWAAMTPEEYRAADARALLELTRTGTTSPFEKEFFRKDGSRIPILLGAASFEQSQDTGVAFVLDLSEHKRAEAEREARHAAEAANRAKSAFLANMSHELRTPLNGILGYAQILQRDPVLGKRQLAGVNVIRKSGEHLLTLINDILDLAKIEAGKMELYPVDIALVRFVQTVTNIVGVKAAQKGLELVYDLAPDLPQWIRVDEKRLRQILLNLLSNAVKFTERGRITLRGRFTPPGRLCFEVQDTGIGIAAEQLKSIFEPFEQAGDMQRRLAGTGLGLTISRQYVRLMGGDIQVESQIGRGSTFRFEVEAQPVQSATAVAAIRTMTGYAGPRKKVLAVDDIADNRAVVTDLLTPLGFEVAEASNGREALEIAQRLRPDLILMDIVMPELDGLAATRLLRQQEAFRDVPVIAMSASVSASDSEQSLAAGMNAFLPKPLDADKLLEQMARLLRLEWLHASAKAKSESGALPLVIPPMEELEVLYRLARLGNMHDIMAYADRLASQDKRYRPFTDSLSALAKSYQSQAVLRLMEEHRQAYFTSHANQ